MLFLRQLKGRTWLSIESETGGYNWSRALRISSHKHNFTQAFCTAVDSFLFSQFSLNRELKLLPTCFHHGTFPVNIGTLFSINDWCYVVADIGASSVINVCIAYLVFHETKWTLWASSKLENSLQVITSSSHRKWFRNVSSLLSAPTNAYLLLHGLENESCTFMSELIEMSFHSLLDQLTEYWNFSLNTTPAACVYLLEEHMHRSYHT